MTTNDLLECLKSLRKAGVELTIKLTPKQMNELNTNGIASDRILDGTVQLICDVSRTKRTEKVKVNEPKKEMLPDSLPLNHSPARPIEPVKELTKVEKFLIKMRSYRSPMDPPPYDPDRAYKTKTCNICGKSFSPSGPRSTTCRGCISTYGKNVPKVIKLIDDFKTKYEHDLTVDEVMQLPNSMRWHFAKHWDAEQQTYAKKLGKNEMDMHKAIDRMAKDSRPVDYKE